MECLQFIDDIEEHVFCRQSIYRTIILTNDDNEKSSLYEHLVERDYAVLPIDEIDCNVNFNNIDKRIVLMNHSLFPSFISHIDENNGGIDNSSFNCIGISYGLDETKTYIVLQHFNDKIKTQDTKNIIVFTHKQAEE